MKTIETDAIVTKTGELNLHLQVDVPPGDYRVLVVIESQPVQQSGFELPVIDIGPWPENLSLRREDLYGDDGR